MRKMISRVAALVVGLGTAGTAMAQDSNGNFMVRILGAGVITQDSVKSLTTPSTDLKAAGFDASVSNEFIPAATLTYFFNKNIAVELFCCFAKHEVELSGPLSGNVASMWIFPPALTLQYHFTGLGAFKPYLGVGAQYIHYFDESTGKNALGATSVNFDDSFGFVLQAGIDVEIAKGWYLNADIKKSWLDTDVKWKNSSVTGSDVAAKVDVDPLIISAGIGYRFNLEDIFGRRTASAAPLK